MKLYRILLWLTLTTLVFPGLYSVASAQSTVPRYGLFENAFKSSANYQNPYTELDAEAEITGPDGSKRVVPLFWDGGKTWKLRISPDTTGKWSYTVHSKDKGLNGKRGSFACTSSNLHGSIQPMQGYPHHFQWPDERHPPHDRRGYGKRVQCPRVDEFR